MDKNENDCFDFTVTVGTFFGKKSMDSKVNQIFRIYRQKSLLNLHKERKFNLKCYMLRPFKIVKFTHRETSRDAPLEFIVVRRICLFVYVCSVIKPNFIPRSLLVNDDKIVNLSKRSWIYFLLKNVTIKKIIIQNSTYL